MPGCADGDGEPFALDGADCRRGEVAEGVGADEDLVAGVDDTWEGGLVGLRRGRGGGYVPLFTTPETTVPTKGTEKQSLTWNSNGPFESNFP